MIDEKIYNPVFVRSLFDEMAKTYGVVNFLSSFGFAAWWRRQCARSITVEHDAVVVDLMAGMGELCTEITKPLDADGKLIAIDISPVMCDRARRHKFKNSYEVIEADALCCPIEANSADNVFSSFGLKTFNNLQLEMLAFEVERILKPGGKFAFLEISVPTSAIVRLPYMFYLQYVIPILGRMFLGNPDNYKMLGIYTSAFGNCGAAGKLFEQTGLVVDYRSYFFGCATGFVGRKPSLS